MADIINIAGTYDEQLITIVTQAVLDVAEIAAVYPDREVRDKSEAERQSIAAAAIYTTIARALMSTHGVKDFKIMHDAAWKNAKNDMRRG